MIIGSAFLLNIYLYSSAGYSYTAAHGPYKDMTAFPIGRKYALQPAY